jgi:Rrf2 family nitric oxide-sensitive transcriptional repressor
MQLSRFTDYSVRVLIYAALFPERLVTLREMADFYDISLAHLRKVVHRLGQLGYLHTVRGKNGGLGLGMPPTAINIGKMVAAMEGAEPLLDCAGLDCAVLPACGVPGMLKRAQRAFYSELEHYTLADAVIRSRVPQVLADGTTRKTARIRQKI